MSTTATNPAFEAKVRRGQPANAGQFTSKASTAPAGGLTAVSTAPVVPYAGEPITRRVGQPGELRSSSMVLDPEQQAGDAHHFHEEHQLDDGRYLTSVHYSYVVDEPTADDGGCTSRVALETEQFVSEEQGAYEKYGHLQRDSDQSTFTRRVGDAWEEAADAESAAKRTAEDVWAYQMTFNSRPFSGEFEDHDVEQFADALDQIRSAFGMDPLRS